MNQMGIATCFFDSMREDLWQKVALAGFSDVEIDVDKKMSTAEIIHKSNEYLAMFRKLGLNVTSLHLPHGNEWDISSSNSEYRLWVFQKLMQIFKWCDDHDIRICVLHASYEPIKGKERAIRLENARHSIEWLGKIANSFNIRIAVENLPRTCLGNTGDEILYLTQDIPNIGVCFDVNHLLGNESHDAFIRKLGSSIITTHLSDYDRNDERHWMPGEGTIDWKALMESFELIPYEGRYIFELSSKNTPSWGAHITPEQLMNHFKSITKGR